MQKIRCQPCPEGYVIRDSRGVALVLTLVVLAIITAMVVEFAYGVYTGTNALMNWKAMQKLSLAAESTVKITSRLIDENRSRNYTYPGSVVLSYEKPVEDFNGTIIIRIEDENARFNLNKLVSQNGMIDEWRYKSFVRLIAALGLQPQIADRIVDWIDPDNEPRLSDSESMAKNGYLDSVDELLVIPGIDRTIYDKLVPYVTIYGNSDSQININGAEVPVLMSLSDSISRETAERIVKYRQNAPFEAKENLRNVTGISNLVYTPIVQYITVKGTAFRILLTTEESGIRRIIDTVLDISGSGTVVKYWKET